MKLVDTAIKKPVTVTVGVILLVLFGFISLFRIPIQLTPNVDLPEISIQTRWSGASPLEVEREIVDVQEEQLKNLDGLQEISSQMNQRLVSSMTLLWIRKKRMIYGRSIPKSCPGSLNYSMNTECLGEAYRKEVSDG